MSQMIEHARAGGVCGKQVWIPHKRCSVDEDKPRLRSKEATKSEKKMGLDYC